MKKTCLFAAILTFLSLQSPIYAADLLEVYQQAFLHDTIFQQAIAQRLANQEGVPISVAALLPNISVTGVPSITRTGLSGSNYVPVIPNAPNYVSPRNSTVRAYAMTLTATQTVFNFAQFATVAQQRAVSKQADATLNAALQSLMVRVTTAYLAILQDEDNLKYSEATKRAYQEQLAQIKQQYKVGLKTMTDLYTAQASYDSAAATVISAQTQLWDDRENLRVITGHYYTDLVRLSEAFPLVTPKPAAINAWVDTALHQNWSIKSAQYNADAARQIIKAQFAGHLPTITAEGTLDRTYTNNINNYDTFNTRNGPGTAVDKQIALTINMPIFSGGAVTAETHQATYNYQVAQEQLDQTILTTLNTTRQSYLGIISGISQVQADKLTIKSTISSLKGLEASYAVGTETLVDVLNQQQKVFQAQTRYASDRYQFVNNLFALKQAAGTLSFEDLRTLNHWLTNQDNEHSTNKTGTASDQ